MIETDELPAGWAQTTLGEIVSNSKAKVEPGERDTAAYLSLEHIESGTSRILGQGLGSEVKSVKSVFQVGDVLYGKLRPYLNKVCLPDFEGICSTDILVLKSKASVDARFLHKLLTTQPVVDHAVANSNGINLPRTSFDALAEFQIDLPPLAEQKRIVARLETLQARSRKAREALADVPTLLEQYRQSVLAAAFRGDLTAAWREQNPNTEPASVLLERIRTERRKQCEIKYPSRTYIEPEQVDDRDLPELPEGWCWASVDALFSIITSGSRDWSQYYDRGTGTFIMAQNVRPGRLDFSETRQLVDPPFNDRDRTRSQILPGDLLITIVGANTGDICPVHDELPNHYVCQSVALMRPVDDDLQGLVLRYFLRGAPGRKIMEDLIYGQGRPHLGFDDLKRIAIPIPPLVEQGVLLNDIQQREVSIDKLLDTTEAASLEFVSFDQSLLSKAFQGELVLQDPSDEPAAAMLARLRSDTSMPAPAVKQPLRIQDVVHDLILLLRNFNKPMERAALELGLVLMQNDDARTSILDKTATPGRAKATGRSYLEGLDHLLGDLAQAKRWIKITTGVPQMITLTTQAPSTDQADALARRRVQETLKVMAAVKKERLPAVVEKICHAAYELVSSS